MLILHILVAISSLGLTGSLFFNPSRKMLLFSYFMVVFTFVSGTYLIIKNPSHLIGACISGILFLGIVGILLFVAKKRIAEL